MVVTHVLPLEEAPKGFKIFNDKEVGDDEGVVVLCFCGECWQCWTFTGAVTAISAGSAYVRWLLPSELLFLCTQFVASCRAVCQNLPLPPAHAGQLCQGGAAPQW